MQSKGKKPPTVSQRAHIERIAALPCSVCDVPGPSEVHEQKQGQWETAIALCSSCHRSSRLGIHGEKRMWTLKKMDELDALAVTIRRMLHE